MLTVVLYFLLFAAIFVIGNLLFVASITLRRMLRDGGLTAYWTVLGYIGAAMFYVFDFGVNLLHILVCLEWRGLLLSRRVDETLHKPEVSGVLDTWRLMVARFWHRQITVVDPKHFDR